MTPNYPLTTATCQCGQPADRCTREYYTTATTTALTVAAHGTVFVNYQCQLRIAPTATNLPQNREERRRAGERGSAKRKPSKAEVRQRESEDRVKALLGWRGLPGRW